MEAGLYLKYATTYFVVTTLIFIKTLTNYVSLPEKLIACKLQMLCQLF